MELPKRKQIRLQNYDYSQNGAYFITICTKKRECLFGKVNATIPQLVSTLKRFTNKKTGRSIWQRSYHDHIIRTVKQYQKIWQYIDTNPLQWQLDCYYQPS